MSQGIRVAAVADVPVGGAIEVTADGRMIALFEVAGTIHALDGICPHAGGPLGSGTMEGCIVTCPWHGLQCDVTTGAHGLAGYPPQTRFPVTIENGDVFVELPGEPSA